MTVAAGDPQSPQDRSRPKVFGIGFHKTGTKSLGAALGILGYRVCGPVGAKDPDIARKAVTLIDTLAWQYDAFQDNPWPLFYERLDQHHAGSRFVLTVRPEDAWLDSVVSHFGHHDTPMRHYIYGVGHPEGNEQAFLDRYRRHNDEVQAYFRHRPEDFLVIDITAGEGWERLCGFLGLEEPDHPFPKLNTRDRRLGPGY